MTALWPMAKTAAFLKNCAETEEGAPDSGYLCPQRTYCCATVILGDERGESEYAIGVLKSRLQLGCECKPRSLSQLILARRVLNESRLYNTQVCLRGRN